eukprot:gene10280-2699_t
MNFLLTYTIDKGKYLYVSIPIFNILFSFIPLFIFVSAIIIYIKKTYDYNFRKKNSASPFNEDNIDELYRHINEIKQENAEPVIRQIPSFVMTPTKHSSKRLTRTFSKIASLTKEQDIINEHNQNFMENNSVIPTKIAEQILDELEDSEKLYWAESPVYRLKQSNKIKYMIRFLLITLYINITFGIISACLVETQNALVVSFIGSLISMMTLISPIYHLISLTGTNSSFAMTQKRIIIVKKKGFLRNDYQVSTCSFDHIHALSTRFVKKYNEYDYGNVYFCGSNSCHPIKVHIWDKRKEDQIIDWKIDRNQNHEYLSLKGVASVEQIEDILEKLLISHWSQKQKKIKITEKLFSDIEREPISNNSELEDDRVIKSRKSLNFDL